LLKGDHLANPPGDAETAFAYILPVCRWSGPGYGAIGSLVTINQRFLHFY